MLGVAVIGCGYWGPNVARNFSALEDCELRALVDLDLDRATKLQRLYPSARVASDPKSVFESSDIDAIAICTPVHTHFELAIAALEAGKHVLVEKPLSHSVECAESICELADRSNLVLQVDHTFVYSAPVLAIRKMIDAGELGDLLYLDSVRINLGLIQSDVNVLWDLAVHDVSIINYLVDIKPEWVSAIGSSHYGVHENLAYLTLMYPDGFIAHTHVNWLAPVKLRSTLIGGSKQMVVYDDLAPSEKLRVYDKGVSLNDAKGDRERALVDYRLGGMSAPYVERSEALAGVCQDFIRCVESGGKPLVDGWAGLEVVRTIEAAALSLRKRGERIPLGTH